MTRFRTVRLLLLALCFAVATLDQGHADYPEKTIKLLVPFPAAVDDHQTHNARFLVDAGAAWLESQAGLTPDKLAVLLQGMDRAQLQAMAEKARAVARTGATEAVVGACIELAKVRVQ